jgi:hypothetical protein
MSAGRIMNAAGCGTMATVAVHTITLGRKEAALQATSTIGARVACGIDMSAVRIILVRAASLDAGRTATGQWAADPMASAHPVLTNATGAAVAMRAVGKRVPRGIPLAEMREVVVQVQRLMSDT